MFRGFNAVTIDAKGRLAVPARHRDLLITRGVSSLVMTISPWDSCIWLYPLPDWDEIETQLQRLPAGDAESRMTRRVVLGHATDCPLDGQGRILVPQELRDLVGVERQSVVLGQGNKLEIWDEAAWQRRRAEWLQDVAAGSASPTSTVLSSLSL